MVSDGLEKLLSRAEKAMRRAYAPYSGFRVGAALWTADGRVFVGCNVENASYGLTNCAERVALQGAVAAGCRRLTAMAIVASGEEAPMPCGACRQVLAEFCGPDFEVLVASSGALGAARSFRLGTLLPHAFKFAEGSPIAAVTPSAGVRKRGRGSNR